MGVKRTVSARGVKPSEEVLEGMIEVRMAREKYGSEILGKGW